jgi:hypothetical protein
MRSDLASSIEVDEEGRQEGLSDEGAVAKSGDVCEDDLKKIGESSCPDWPRVHSPAG